MFIIRTKETIAINCPEGHVDSKKYPVILLLDNMGGITYCPVCGLQLRKYVEKTETESVCSACDFPVNDKWIFCMKCGSKGRREK